MQDTIAVTGWVGSTPRRVTVADGLEITEFRLGSTRRRLDKQTQEWVDAETNWYTVKSYRRLAANVAASVQSGQRVVVVGRLKMRSWEKDGRRGMSVDIEAETVGHDLLWGTAVFTRPRGGAAAISDEDDAFGEPDEPAGVDESAADRVEVPF